MSRIIEIIETEEIFDIIEEGTTKPVRCRLRNGMDVVVKYPRNPAGTEILVYEFIGSCIAEMIGVTVPDFGICNFSVDVIRDTNLNEDIDEENAGLAFYCEYRSKTIPLHRSLLSSVVNKETEEIILLDHILNNCDRHDGNLLFDLANESIIYAIDHSQIITREVKPSFDMLEKELSEEALFSKHILNDNRELYDLLCVWLCYDENRLKELAVDMKRILLPEKLEKIKNMLPNEWIISVGSDKINKMFDILKHRINGIERISDMIIEERRKK